MRQVPRAYIALIPLLIAAAGFAVWRRPSGGYPDVVYYVDTRVTYAGAIQGHAEEREWFDARGQRALMRETGRNEDLRVLCRDGRVSSFFAGQPASRLSVSVAPVPSGGDAYCNARFQQLTDGFTGVGRAYLSQANGPIARVRLDGHAALRCAIAAAAGSHHWVWLDARTLFPLREEVTFPSVPASTLTSEYVHLERLAPHTLPTGFFELPRPHHPWWDGMGGWLSDAIRAFRRH